MTIKYLDSKRISALSGDTKPTNVETNSILVEKDTGVRRWFDGTTWSGIWNYNHDFSTDDGKWGFKTASTTNKVDTAGSLLLMNTKSSNTSGISRTCSGDLIGGVVSDTAWVLQIDRFKFNTKVNYSQNALGMSDKNYTTDGYTANDSGFQTQDLLYFYVYHGNTDTTRLGWTTGGNVGNGDNTTATDTWSTGTDYYVQMIRTSATSATSQMGTNSDFTSPTINLTNSLISSAVGGLRYFKTANLVYTGFSEGDMTAQLDTMRFADGVTVAP